MQINREVENYMCDITHKNEIN